MSSLINETVTVMELENKGMALKLNNGGYIVSCKSKVKPGEFLAEPSPLISAIKDGIEEFPVSLQEPQAGYLHLRFKSNAIIELKYEIREYGIVFEIISVRGAFDRLTFTALQLNLSGIVGRSVGVVRGREVAFAYQGLNRATDGGAKPLPGGSEIFGVGYGKDGYKGMRWCLFSCSPEDVMSNIELIEKAEPGLPYLQIGGKWIKASDSPRPHLMAPRRIPVHIGVEMVLQAGFDMLYLLPDVYESSGHYKIASDKIPGGAEGLKQIAGKLAESGAGILLHSMSGQITANDPYITPEPDSRMLQKGYAVLDTDIGPDDMNIRFRNVDMDFLKSPKYLAGTNLEAGEDISGTSPIHLGKEIICPEKLLREDNYVVAVNCQRGAYGTTPETHTAGMEARILIEYWSKGSFFPEPASDLPEEVAENLADTIKQSGARMLAFDGLEALSYGENPDALNDRLMLEDSEAYNDPRRYCRSASNRFAERLLNLSGLNLLGVSTVTHYNWHLIFCRGGGEITMDLRSDFQTRFNRNSWAKRNLLDVSMGAHDIRLCCEDWGEATHLEDIEFLCTKAAAVNSTFDIFVYTTEHGRQKEIFETMRLWLEARRCRAFAAGQLAQYQDMNIDAKIHKDQNGNFSLTPVVQGKRYCLETSGESGIFNNPFDSQPAQYSIQILPAFQDNHSGNIVLPLREKVIRLDSDAEVLFSDSVSLTAEEDSFHLNAIRRVQTAPGLVRWICPFNNIIDLSKNRGLEVVLDVDTPDIVFYVQLKDSNGMLRTYLWKLDSSGEHTLFLANGEISSDNYHDYGSWGDYSPWFSAMKTVAYNKMAEVAFGFTGMQVQKPCSVKLKTITAMREILDPVHDLTLDINGKKTVVDAEICPFDYLNISPDGTAVIYDSNWNSIQKTTFTSQIWKSGKNTFTVDSPAKNKNWLRLRPVFIDK